jgi:V/A-type H+-transporting ATPase subunit I
MAIARMAKVIIVSYRTEASELLEALQREGICHILNADEAIVSRDFPDLGTRAARPKDIEGLLNRLEKGITFLANYAKVEKGLAAALSPRTVVDERSYQKIVSDKGILKTVDACERLEASMERANGEIESLRAALEMLAPWFSLETPVEEMNKLRKATCWAGLIPSQQFEPIEEKLSELGGAIQRIGAAGNRLACLVVSLKERTDDVQKVLRSAESEPVGFEGMIGTAQQLISEYSQKLDQAQRQLQSCADEATALSKNLLKLHILHDHYQNLLNREQTRGAAPATERTVLLEGWVKRRDFSRLQKVVSHFGASSLTEVEPADDEDVPVEIENTTYVRPFESITRLYGMPEYSNIDPTIFLAPFFALFFALCLTDAAYGIIMIGLIVWLARKMQGDKKMMRMFTICSVVTIFAGALTGGWFGNAIGTFIFGNPDKSVALWFDPIQKPMNFFILSLALGYFQVIFGICVALAHNLKRQDYIAAIFDQVTWLVMLNSLVVFGLSKAGVLPSALAGIFGPLAAVPALAIFLGSEREGGWGQRLGMGGYNLFSTVFFVGDILSYARLMALGMVTAGFGMAINVIVEMVAKIPIPVLGVVLAAIIFVGGHLFNLGMSMLSAFVHTLRLQFVEFFPKFFVGGGRAFVPLAKEYKHICISEQGADAR